MCVCVYLLIATATFPHYNIGTKPNLTQLNLTHWLGFSKESSVPPFFFGFWSPPLRRRCRRRCRRHLRLPNTIPNRLTSPPCSCPPAGPGRIGWLWLYWCGGGGGDESMALALALDPALYAPVLATMMLLMIIIVHIVLIHPFSPSYYD
ncbi:hypothetical protein BO70DRAFT_121710 [Aspergillus heteromorphus CBS 117.55]|uniref:Uncharacterized protein n=1 Tax=Aspergillus heteromorphus CBS 117.55 TaxID=1448321 RepID=A0A317VBX9_9EURO|nr:uncharacterized protein BO70DRAFT_121710 [Aspergillus heteromorphus CBS 117.55]PWY71726.1 hypothetical protein BO70DRAFT_121710 [Aspergillus heteromorphus CBS 117.55]